MLAGDPGERRRRADALARPLGGEVVPTVGRVGGGALPLAELASYAVALPDPPDALAARLRTGEPAVAPRVHEGGGCCSTCWRCRTPTSRSCRAAVARARAG